MTTSSPQDRTSYTGRASAARPEARATRRSGIAITRLDRRHVEQARALSTAVGWPHRPEDWLFVLGLGSGFAACDGNRLVGTAMIWLFGDTLATLGMVIVAPDMKGRGIGRELVTAALAGVKARTVALNATEEGIPLYRSLGFYALGGVPSVKAFRRYSSG